jgi:hypothetical protein
MPAYDGRIPGNAIEFFRCLGADRTPAVAIVSYGARDYGDALCELKDRCEGKGFVTIAAGAFVGEHALCIRDCPYEAKYLEGEAFSRSISELAASCGERNEAELII